MDKNLERLLQPFWLGSRMEEESLFFIRDNKSGMPTASLLFAANNILAMRRTDGTAQYQEGKDYLLTSEQCLSLPPNSAIPFKTSAEMQSPPGAPQSIAAARGEGKHLFFSEGHVFHDLQAAITYDHDDDKWQGPLPQNGLAALPLTAAKLQQGKPVRLALLGDSITAGYNASQHTGAPPFQPPYGELVAAALEHRCGSAITCVNTAVAGVTSAWGLANISQVTDVAPDLVVLAFGMNDASGGVTPERFRENIHAQMLAVRQKRPVVEFILVAGMAGNPEWTRSAPDLYPRYRDELHSLCGEGVALADVTTVWNELVKRKNFASLTGNGVNHPNDFGHRIYAQVILELMNRT